MFRRLATAAFLSITFAAGALAADTKPHRVAIQVDQNDPQLIESPKAIPSRSCRTPPSYHQAWFA